ALTDADGRYFILNIPVGEYAIRAELIGYAPVEVQNLSVSNDLTTYTDIQMTSKVIDIGQVQTVIAERPLVIMDQTASLRVVDKEEIQRLPTRGYQDIVALSSGVVQFNDNVATRQRGSAPTSSAPSMNIRGGRHGEVAYFVDGFVQQDPLSNLATTTVNNNAIDVISISTGGFNAEYGWVSSGAVNVTTREGTKEYHGSIEVVTDNLPFLEGPPDEGEEPNLDPAIGYSYDYNTYAANFDGPLLPNFDRASFFLSAERRWQRDRAPRATANGRLPVNSMDGWTWHGKIKFEINPKHFLRLGTLGSKDDWRLYTLPYYFCPERAPRYVDKNQSYYAKWTATLSPRTFFEVGGTYYITERERGDGVFFDDLDKYYVSGNYTRFDETELYRPPDGAYFYPGYRHRKSSYYGFNFDITSQVNRSNEVKFGVDFETHKLRRYEPAFVYNIKPEDPDSVKFQNIDYYGYDASGKNEVDEGDNGVKKPYMMAAYLQDKIEWEGLVINAGLRWDYMNVNTKRLRNQDRPLDPDSTGDTQLDESDFVDAEAETKLSPRIGVGFPISNRTVFHINYGKFFQRPELQNVYVGTAYLDRMVSVSPYYDYFGNPNLMPEQTTAYEVGLSHQLGDYTALNVTAYYKDVRDLTVVRRIAFQKFATFRNEDFGTIKGLDFQFKARRQQGIAMELNYSLSWANGTGSAATTQTNIAWQDSESPLLVAPLDYDQRHKLTAIVDIRAGKKEGPKLGEIYPLENAGVNFVFRAASGTPYTPSNVWNEVTLGSGAPVPIGRINSRYGPWTYRLDLKANRGFDIGGLSFDIYLWVLNVFDTKNVIDVYEGTGQPDNTGFLATDEGQNVAADFEEGFYEEMYNLRQKDPLNYDVPRIVRLGLRMNF
ncbi:MAG: TonB-dependent receptor, partial [candidate division Zixibacteria bacterium]|nr:TonB-dependent receptor [candidate division Zixibacteria bacterium]